MIIKIIDSTLREGRQNLFYDKVFKIQDEYLEILSKIGVNDIEYRNPSISSKETIEYKKLKKKFPKINFYIHIFLNNKNVEWSIKDKSVENISTFLTSPIKQSSLDLIERLASESKKKVRVAIENSPTISKMELKKVLKMLNKYPSIKQIGFSDTMGMFTPDSIKAFVFSIKNVLVNKDIEFHLHNDFGLAASNAVQVLSEFKNTNINLYFSTSMYGLGERNGILSYGDLFSNLLRLEIPHNFNLKHYGKLLKIMNDQEIFFNRDPLNKSGFYHSASSHIISGIHGRMYENINPNQLGLNSELIFNESTTDEAYNLIASQLLKKQISENRAELKDYVILSMQRQKKDFLLLGEVKNLIISFYKKITKS